MIRRNAILLSLGGTILLLILMAVLFAPRSEEDTTKRETLEVAATIYPIYDITRTIMGQRGRAHLLIPPGASPHTFELSPSTMTRLLKVKAVFKIGYGLDDWTDKITENIPGVEIVTVDTGIAVHKATVQNHGTFDPHYWLDLRNARHIAENIYHKITERDPSNRPYYAQNLQRLIDQLIGADTQIRDGFAALPHRKIITFHDAWYYFADAYGLEVVATFAPSPGKEPMPQDLKNITDAVHRHAMTALFSEPQLSTRILIPFADDLGLTIYTLDPIGGTDHESYVERMRRNAEVIVRALQQ